MQAMGGLSGRRLAGYELGAFRGEDGFGPLYEARNLHLGRTFTMRVLSDQFTFAQGFEEAFLRVAQVLSTLEHANLLTLDDFGMDGPYAYLVTPSVEGLTLETWLRQRPGQPVNPAQVTRLFGQMLAGLGHAHQTGVTHLGLEPRHFLVQPNGHVLVANFGLPYLAEQLWITWNNKRSFGDPLYLAPEQIPGRTPFGVAADLYTLGIMLYRLLTGTLPFEGPEQALLQAKLAGPPPLRATNASLPAALEAIVQRSLAAAPADRWTSVEEFGAAFYQALGQENPLAASPSPAGPTRGVSLLLPPDETGSPARVSGPTGRSKHEGETPLGRRGVRRVGRVKIPGGHSGPPAAGPAPQQSGGKALSFSSAGKGRIAVPPPPPGWNAEESVSANDFLPPKSMPRRLFSALVRVVILLVTLVILSGAIFYGYQRWSSIQHQMVTPTPTVTPVITPTPKKG
jgi:serine/threonine protein kinase